MPNRVTVEDAIKFYKELLDVRLNEPVKQEHIRLFYRMGIPWYPSGSIMLEQVKDWLERNQTPREFAENVSVKGALESILTNAFHKGNKVVKFILPEEMITNLARELFPERQIIQGEYLKEFNSVPVEIGDKFHWEIERAF